ncbi:major facilitator superfamily-domain-containing protein [Aspergillus pseudocaelatus]|uniref:Major facilitator superfamily-domain-containing protein n=1 Tax=Aspergillus pseudocaelatus TaxID=1825620 RepID=A0ABQ6X1Q4_9EURO|nr:major facilitator superfamily-domain-containing protein [Aspergillus pseudocaelatus]
MPFVDADPEKQGSNGNVSSTGSSENVVPKDTSPRPVHGWKWAIAYASMISTTFLFALDNTIVADIQPVILDLFGEVSLLPWIGVGFALGTMCVLPWGKVYGVFNVKYVYLFNIALFEIGSAVCGAAPNMTALVVGRVIAGVGGSGMYSGTLSFVAMLTSLKERPIYMAGSTVIWGIGSVLGPVVGGAFADSSATWRWAFYINLPIGAVFAPSYLLLVPSVDPQPSKSWAEKCRMVDWIMTTMFLAGSASLVMAITFGGTLYAWSSGNEIALWVVAGVLLIVCIGLARFHPGVDKDNRLYPAHFFKRAILVNLQLQMFLVSGIVLAMTYYIPLFFQFIRGDGPLDAGVRLLPFIISMVVFAMGNGALMPKLPYILPWHLFGSALVVAGTGLLYGRNGEHTDTADLNTSNAKIYGYCILVGAGSGCYAVAGFAVVQSLVPLKEIPNAVGAMAISQDLGMVIFLAMAGSIYQNLALQKVAQTMPALSAADITNLVAGTSSRAYKALSEEERALVTPQITDAMSNVWLFFLVAGILSFVLTPPLGKTRLKGANAAEGGA